MGLLMVTQTAEQLSQMAEPLAAVDQEYVIQFAFRTGDREMTNKLIDELIQPLTDRRTVYQKFETMTGFEPDWIHKIENLLVALELYRMEEENAVRNLSAILGAYDISITEEELRKSDADTVRDKIKERSSL